MILSVLLLVVVVVACCCCGGVVRLNRKNDNVDLVSLV